jgi:hypothetical protein
MPTEPEPPVSPNDSTPAQAPRPPARPAPAAPVPAVPPGPPPTAPMPPGPPPTVTMPIPPAPPPSAGPLGPPPQPTPAPGDGAPPDRPTPPARGRLFPLVALALGMTALLSLFAIVLGAVAIATANEAKDTADRAAARPVNAVPEPAPAAEPPLDPTDTPAPTSTADTPNDLPSEEPGPLEPSANFQIHYGDQKLRLQANCSDRQVDLDEPRVTPDVGADLSYSGCSPGNLELTFNSELRVSQLPTKKASASECAEAIRSSAGNNSMAPAQGLTLCVLTAKSQATDQGIPQKIVLFRIDSMAKDGTLNVSVTAWTVPV